MDQIFPRMMLVDMNSFFASVEQQANPFYRGRPLGVSNSRTEGSCLIGTSKEAKALGIKNGIPLYKAKKICPQILVVNSEPEKYREVNRRIVKIFRDYTDKLEVYSVDEAFLEFSYTPSNSPFQGENNPAAIPPLKGEARRGKEKNNLLAIAAEIKQRIKQEVGEWLTCSIGIAQNKFLCKLAADMSAEGGSASGGQNTDSISILWRDQLAEVYKGKKLSDLWGINHGWTNRLAKLGIFSPLQLLEYPVANLISLFGKPGYWLWERVNGLEIDQIKNSNIEYRNPKQYLNYEISNDQNSFEPLDFENLNLFRASDLEFRISEQPKSFGHSWVLNFRTTDKEKLKIAILRLAEKASRRMRSEGFIASGMYLSITLVDSVYFRRSKKLKVRIETGLELYQQALNLWQSWHFSAEIMHIAVGFTHLHLKTTQLSLFPDKFLELTQVLDSINDKYGEFTVRAGLLTKTSSFAPDAIAFGK